LPTEPTDFSPMIELLSFISNYIITPYTWVVIIAVIMSWLIGFNVINGYNPVVRTIWQTVTALTDPLLKPIRRMLPNLGGLDLSPMVLLLGCIFVQSVIFPNLAKLFV
jgi:YggT family protein